MQMITIDDVLAPIHGVPAANASPMAAA